MYGDNCFYCMGRGTGGAWSKLASLMVEWKLPPPPQLNVFLCSLLSLQNIEIVFWVAKCQMSYAPIQSHQTHNNPILHDFTSSASAISENSNKDCDNHALIIKVSSTNMQCLTHISLIVLALAVYLALELSAKSKRNILGAFQYRKENMFSQVSSKILFKGLVFRCNPLSESFCIFSKLHWFAWLSFIAFQLLQDEETFSVQWFSNKYHF